MENERCNKHGESLSALEVKVDIIEKSVLKMADAQVNMISSVATIKEVTATLKDVTIELKKESIHADDRLTIMMQTETNKINTDLKSVDIKASMALNKVNWLYTVCKWILPIFAIGVSSIFGILKLRG